MKGPETPKSYPPWMDLLRATQSQMGQSQVCLTPQRKAYGNISLEVKG